MATRIIPLPPTSAHDYMRFGRSQIQKEIARMKAEDNKIVHHFADLDTIYPPNIVRYYDLSSMGFTLASQIPPSLTVKSLLDLGCGTGLTAEASIRYFSEQPDLQVSYLDMVVVDGVRTMVTAAVNKVKRWMETTPPMVGKVHHIVNDIYGELGYLQGLAPFELITVQRVLIDCRPEARAQQLQKWATLLHDDGNLLVDVQHPSRQPSALFVGPGSVSAQAMHAQFTKCFQVCDAAVFEECRTYAKELALAAGLQILNGMPAQLPPTTEDVQPIIATFLNNTCTATATDSLGRDERKWVEKRWVGKAIQYYSSRGFAAQPDIASVVVVLGRGMKRA